MTTSTNFCINNKKIFWFDQTISLLQNIFWKNLFGIIILY